MATDTLLALTAICFATVWTPGPNNALLAASGARFSLRASLPHALGVACGFPVMMALIGLGLGEVFRAVPVIAETLRWAGAVVLLWLAWKILGTRIQQPGNLSGRPWRFHEAVLFQWINPKAWIMAISVASQFVTSKAPVLETLICASVFLFTGLTSALGWVGIGTALQRWLAASMMRLRVFNGIMALLIVTTVVALLHTDLVTLTEG